jgi:3,4-dihydroxyphenylacetate 2,3-dioxygenase
MLPPVNLRPPFNITRASHLVLHVANLAKSRDFYVKIIGLVVSEETDRVCYLRGLAEACHHSLVLVQSRDEPTCARVGLRVFFDEDLDLAYQFFKARNLPAEWAETPHQGRTLHVSDPIGTRIELCAQMTTCPRLHLKREIFTGAQAQCYDHYQVLAPDVSALCSFYGELGFRSSEYLAHGDKLLGSFMYRKGTCLDLAIVHGQGPRLHHFAYLVPAVEQIFAACDLAGNYGFASSVERGPGRHGPGGVLFVYLRDPDGHRVELFTSHYPTIDIEIEPVRWEAASLSTSVHWGLPAPARWYFEATNFEGTPVVDPAEPPNPETLESYVQKLSAKN